MLFISEADKTRFWSKVNKIEHGCWEWNGMIAHGNGYGTFHIKAWPYRAHRIVWMIVHNEDPAEFFILHKCHNKKCVNPAHLEKGTPAENSKDMTDAGRSAKGSRNGWARITEELAMLIFKAQGSQREIAKQYGVTQKTVSDIKKKKAWAHIHNDS